MLLSTLLVGIIYGGITFYDYVTLANAVTVAAKTIATNRAVVGTSTTNACTMGESDLYNAAVGLNRNSIEINTGSGSEYFPGGSSCTALGQGDSVIVTATYPCSLYFPGLGINTCSMGPASGQTTGPTTVTLLSGAKIECLTAYCITATASARIE
jgi:Flp pilus assembly protein TadG